jgi:hypothetical protein
LKEEMETPYMNDTTYTAVTFQIPSLLAFLFGFCCKRG